METNTLITITRRLAFHLRPIFRKALNATRNPGPALHFTTGPDGMRVKSKFGDAAVEYSEPGELPHAEMWLPFAFLADVEARRDDPVRLEATDDHRAAAHWRDGNVPQCIQYDPITESDTDNFPEMPQRFTKNAARLLQALHDAVETTDPDSTRYALGCVQLRGKTGALATTDGRQILIENGFEFPWDDDVLIPRTKVFGHKELPQDVPVQIGKTENWVAVRIGPWTFGLRINKDGRYPTIDDHIPKATNAAASIRMSSADKTFLTETLPKLPCNDEYNGPVTVDLNGAVAIRAKGEGPSQPTELVLSGAALSGESTQFNCNRKFLARAVHLGFDNVHVYSPKVPVLCQDDRRSYVFALLDANGAVPPAKDAVRIESPVEKDGVETTNQPKRRRSRTKMSQTKANSNGKSRTAAKRTSGNGKADQNDVAALIEQAEAVKASARETLTKTSELIAALKQHRKQNRIVQSTLASLRQLKTIGA